MADRSAVIAALLGDMPLAVRPYDPSRDHPTDMGLGGLSTEYLRTYDTPFGESVNVPSIWFTESGLPFLSPDPYSTAMDYEAATGRLFPTYDTTDEAVTAAKMRSANGGAQHRALTDDNATILQRRRLFGLGE